MRKGHLSKNVVSINDSLEISVCIDTAGKSVRILTFFSVAKVCTWLFEHFSGVYSTDTSYNLLNGSFPKYLSFPLDDSIYLHVFCRIGKGDVFSYYFDIRYVYDNGLLYLVLRNEEWSCLISDSNIILRPQFFNSFNL